MVERESGHVVTSGPVRLGARVASPPVRTGWNVTEPPVGTGADLDDLSDVDTTGATAGQTLRFDGARWVPTASTPTGGAGGVLSGQYPNPGFAVNMASQAELTAHIVSPTPHAVYDDMPSLSLLLENRLV